MKFRIAKYYLLLFLFLFSACDLLSTRQAEPPNASRDNFLPATSPEILFSNLTNSFKDKVVENYIACFSDPAYTDKAFNFVPTSSASVIYAAFSNWDLSSERGYFSNLVNTLPETTPIILSLSQLGSTQYSDSAVYDFSYVLNTNFSSENISPTYQGNLKFTVVLDNRQQWVISRWIDFEKTGSPSWSELKGRMY
jgi:hypothetical protein